MIDQLRKTFSRSSKTNAVPCKNERPTSLLEQFDHFDNIIGDRISTDFGSLIPRE